MSCYVVVERMFSVLTHFCIDVKNFEFTYVIDVNRSTILFLGSLNKFGEK